jgi:hypothetical protein
MREIQNLLIEIDALPISEQYDGILKLSNEILKQNKYREESQAIEIILDKIHALRFKLAYNKATDSGLKDAELKRVWEKLKTLL